MNEWMSELLARSKQTQHDYWANKQKNDEVEFAMVHWNILMGSS